MGKQFLFPHVDTRFTWAESKQPERRTYNYTSVPESRTIVYRLINNGIFIHCLYRQNTDHVRIYKIPIPLKKALIIASFLKIKLTFLVYCLLFMSDALIFKEGYVTRA